MRRTQAGWKGSGSKWEGGGGDGAGVQRVTVLKTHNSGLHRTTVHSLFCSWTLSQCLFSHLFIYCHRTSEIEQGAGWAGMFYWIHTQALCVKPELTSSKTLYQCHIYSCYKWWSLSLSLSLFFFFFFFFFFLHRKIKCHSKKKHATDCRLLPTRPLLLLLWFHASWYKMVWSNFAFFFRMMYLLYWNPKMHWATHPPLFPQTLPLTFSGPTAMKAQGTWMHHKTPD